MQQDDLDELRRGLLAELELLAETLLGEPNKAMSSRQQLRFGAHGSLAVELRRNRGAWFSHEAGTGGDPIDLIRFALGGKIADAIAWARRWRNSAPAAPPVAKPQQASVKPQTSAWRSIWTEARPIGGTLGEIYLEARGCAGAAMDALRFHPECPRGATERLPAMVALMTEAGSNEPAGVHRTFLRADGRGKIEHGTAKMMLGNAGVIRLTPDDHVTLGLGIAEGIETSLALINRAGWRAVWATGSAGGIAKFPVLAGIETLTIFPDRDDGGASQKAAEHCSARWRLAGREVQTIWPPAGGDWLDALKVAA